MPSLGPRDLYYDDCTTRNGVEYCRHRSPWNDWVRWVVLAVIVVGFFLLFILCSCITARRRRKAGRQPFYGTGWAARPGYYGNAQPYYNNQYQHPPPPQYSAQPPPNHSYYGGDTNQSYYAQQNGVELQQPQPTYNRGADDVYTPPPGPPPGKGDGIVR